MMDDQKLMEAVIAEFEALTHIPRPSGHERAVSDYLKKRFGDLGCAVTQDAHNNIVADLPATPGKEHAPLTRECPARHSPRAHGYGLCRRTRRFV